MGESYPIAETQLVYSTAPANWSRSNADCNLEFSFSYIVEWKLKNLLCPTVSPKLNVNIYIYMYVCIYMCVCMCLNVYICASVYMFKYIYIRVCVCVCVCVWERERESLNGFVFLSLPFSFFLTLFPPPFFLPVCVYTYIKIKWLMIESEKVLLLPLLPLLVLLLLIYLFAVEISGDFRINFEITIHANQFIAANVTSLFLFLFFCVCFFKILFFFHNER